CARQRSYYYGSSLYAMDYW
nr:immunoglobulin heavy chain junction region [Mus musculus]